MAQTSSDELKATSSAQNKSKKLSRHVLDRALEQWKLTGTAADAADAVDAAIVLGSHEAAAEPAKQLIANSDVVDTVRQAASKLLGIIPDGPIAELSASVETHTESVRAAIRSIKSYLVDAPRDAITTMEIARLYALSGQSEKAEKFIRRATLLAPNNRYVLRASARFYTFREEPEEALKLLWKSDAVRVDPWLQAAEVAVSDASNRNPKWGHKGLRNLTRVDNAGTSELAAAMATVEFKNSAKRREVRRLLEFSLHHPSENVIAQALWLEQKANISVEAVSHLTDDVSNAGEAQSFVAFESGNYQEAALRVKDWIADQPFQVRSFLNGNLIYSVYLDDNAEALRIGKIGEAIHPSNWLLANGNFLAAALGGKISEAASYLKKLENFTSDSLAQPFIEAARGLMSYLRKDIFVGRKYYLSAIEAAVKIKKPDLIMNAYIFMLEQEAKIGALNKEDLIKEINYLESKISKLGITDKKSVSRLWNHRRPIIEAFVDIPAEKTSNFDAGVSKDILQAVSSI